MKKPEHDKRKMERAFLRICIQINAKYIELSIQRETNTHESSFPFVSLS